MRSAAFQIIRRRGGWLRSCTNKLRRRGSRLCFSTDHEAVGEAPSSSSSSAVVDPILDVSELDNRVDAANMPEEMASRLRQEGYYYTKASPFLLTRPEVVAMRQQALKLRAQQPGRFEPWRTTTNVLWGAGNIDSEKDYKNAILSTQLDGDDYETAPDIVLYMSWLLQRLPLFLNESLKRHAFIGDDDGVEFLSDQVFASKLAIMPSSGGTVYPLHVDNPQPLDDKNNNNDVDVVDPRKLDPRKLTAILYLNPDYNQERDGGELRIYTTNNNEQEDGGLFHDITPDGGRLVLFWSDEMPHEVLPTTTFATDDRYALTVWISTNSPQRYIHSASSKFRNLQKQVLERHVTKRMQNYQP